MSELAETSLVNTASLPLNGVKNINITYQAESIMLKHSRDGQLTIKEYMSRKEPELFAEIVRTDNTVNLRHGRREDIPLSNRIEVYIPAGWYGALSISTIDGSISTQCDWRLSSLDALSVVGSVELNTVDADTIRLSSYTGSLFLACCTGNLDFRTVNGAIRVDKVSGGGNVITINGNQQLYFNELNRPVKLSSENGEISLRLPQAPSFELNARSITGAIYSSFDTLKLQPGQNQAHSFTGEAPYHHVEISTTTGNIHISDSL